MGEVGDAGEVDEAGEVGDAGEAGEVDEAGEVGDAGEAVTDVPATQYASEANLVARQRLWANARRGRPFDLHRWVLDLAGLPGTGVTAALEVGCGNGAYLSMVDAVGVDVSLGMIRAAQIRAIGPVVCAQVERLPFAGSSFDVVLAPHMLYHVPDRVEAARELRRVLRPGGNCVVVVNGLGNQRELTALLEDVVGHGWRWMRPDLAFSLEDGGEQLRPAFAEVRRVDCPVGPVIVEDAGDLAAYVASVSDVYGSEVSSWTSWDEVVESCRRRVQALIDADGGFRISTSVGAFVCR